MIDLSERDLIVALGESTIGIIDKLTSELDEFTTKRVIDIRNKIRYAQVTMEDQVCDPTVEIVGSNTVSVGVLLTLPKRIGRVCNMNIQPRGAMIKDNLFYIEFRIHGETLEELKTAMEFLIEHAFTCIIKAMEIPKLEE